MCVPAAVSRAACVCAPAGWGAQTTRSRACSHGVSRALTHVRALRASPSTSGLLGRLLRGAGAEEGGAGGDEEGAG